MLVALILTVLLLISIWVIRNKIYWLYLDDSIQENFINETPRELALRIDRRILSWGGGFSCSAIVNNDASFCEKQKGKDMETGDQSSIEQCLFDYYKIAYLITGEYHCDKLSGDKRLVCEAMYSDDINKCSVIKDSDYAGLCNLLLGKATESDCNKLKDEDKGLCLIELHTINAVRDNDVNQCNNIKQEKYRRRCVAILTNDADLCRVRASDCLDESYFRGMDEAKCEFITNLEAKDMCLKTVQKQVLNMETPSP